MVNRVDIPLVDGSYSDLTLPFTCQECINYIPEPSMTEGSRTGALLRGAPGYTQYADYTTVGEFSGGPIRGQINVEGKLFVVSGTLLIEQTPSGPEVRGRIPGTKRVGMAYNQIAGGNQLCIGNGPQGFVYNTATGSFNEITDPAFAGGRSPVFLDGYIAWVSLNGDFWFHSELADALSYNSLDRYQGETSPDKLVCLRVLDRQIYAFSQSSIEVFVNTGAATNTFQRQAAIQEGAESEFSPVVLDNSIIWVDANGLVKRMFDYSPQKISTFQIDQLLSTLSDDRDTIIAFDWVDRGHEVYYFTIGTYTFGYDVATQKWHRRESYRQGRWRVAHTTYWNNQWIAGDYLLPKIYSLDWSVYTENSQPLIALRRTGVMSNAQGRLTVNAVELLLNTGYGPIGENAKVMLRYSDDGGRNWSSYRELELGEVGEYLKRVQTWRLGSFRQRVWEISVSNNVPRDLMGAVMVVEAYDS